MIGNKLQERDRVGSMGKGLLVHVSGKMNVNKTTLGLSAVFWERMYNDCGKSSLVIGHNPVHRDRSSPGTEINQLN